MGEASRSRWLIFGAVCVTIVASAALFGGLADRPLAPEDAAEQGAGRGLRIDRSTRALLAEVERRRQAAAQAARGFLNAYFLYEVGRSGAAVRRDLRRWATPRLARDLLRAPPRPPSLGGFPPRAVLRKLDVVFVSANATRALVNGFARRAGTIEDFSFVFVRGGDGGWRAARPGQ